MPAAVMISLQIIVHDQHVRRAAWFIDGARYKRTHIYTRTDPVHIYVCTCCTYDPKHMKCEIDPIHMYFILTANDMIHE